MSERSVTTTKDIREAYKKNIGFYIPGYGHVTNFKNFYDNELAGQVSLKSLEEGARTNPKFIEEIDTLRNSVIKQYDKGGTSEPELIRTDRQTKNGRAIYKLGKEDVSEITTTFQNEDGKWVNAPSLNFGRIYNEEDVKKMYSSMGDIRDLETGRLLTKYNTLEEAVKAAKEDSDSLSKDQTKSDDYKAQFADISSNKSDDYKAQFADIPQNRPTFAEKFKDYKNSKEMEALFVLNEYEKLNEEIKKDKPNQYGTFKETFAAERRKAIKDGTLDTHTFEYTNTKTGETRLYHARTVNEQAKWLRKRREEEDA